MYLGGGKMITEDGILIRVQLAKSSMTQQDLAKSIGITPSYLSDLLRGKKNGPKAQEKVKLIMKSLGL